jgi:hypothetical protein
MLRDSEREIELDDVISQEMSRILIAMRDRERFPAQLPGGAEPQQIVYVANVAKDYWRLIEPFCWSLQVAARWASPPVLTPWAKAMRSLCTEALKFEG